MSRNQLAYSDVLNGEFAVVLLLVADVVQKENEFSTRASDEASEQTLLSDASFSGSCAKLSLLT
jgi:hypothetical protein